MENAPKKKGVTVGAVVGFLFVGFLIYSAYSIATWSNKDSGAPTASQAQTSEDLSSKAFVIAQSFVKASLKSPSTAKFPMLDYTAANLGSNQYRIASYVDSQNGFGAMIRGKWQTTLTYNGGDWADSDNWTLNELIFNGQVVYQKTSTTP